ncbi:MAG: MFS transporter [Firmicutes bacterium]|nr:MFS transporter [Bacillota bacterium]
MDTVIKKKEKIIFRNRDFMLLLLGQLVSNIGNAVHSAAVSLYIMDLVGEGNSGMFIGIFGICMAVPGIIFGPLSGVFADKFDRKKIIVGTDFIRGILMLILLGFIYFDIVPLIALFTMTAISAFFGSFFNPAVSASIPNIVEEKNLTKANSFSGMGRQLTWIVGMAISGFLYYYIGFVGVLVVNGLSFILSALSEMFINIPQNKKKVEKLSNESDNKEEYSKEETEIGQSDENEKVQSSFWEDFKDGLRVIRGQKAIMTLLGFVIVLNFLFNPIFQVVFPKTIKFTLGMGAREYGLLYAVSPVGSILGMLLLSILPQKEKNYGMMMFTIFMHGFLLAILGLPILPFILGNISNSMAFFIFCAIFFMFGVFNALLNVPLTTTFQKKIPDEYRGRFFGILGTVSQGITPLGLLVIGFIADTFHPSAIFITVGLMSILLTIWMLFVKELKEL